MEYPLEEARKLLEKGGMKADDSAVHEFAQLLEEITADIASEADASARRSKRKAANASDIKSVTKHILSL